jgi:prepilin-type processing-associated H-X9-DG protein
MLLPALQKARESALDASCKSNLKQLATENMMYANDWNGVMVHDGKWMGQDSIFEWYTHGGLSTTMWFEKIGLPGGKYDKAISADKPQRAYPNPLQRCPWARSKPLDYVINFTNANTNWIRPDYAINAYLGGARSGGSPNIGGSGVNSPALDRSIKDTWGNSPSRTPKIQNAIPRWMWLIDTPGGNGSKSDELFYRLGGQFFDFSVTKADRHNFRFPYMWRYSGMAHVVTGETEKLIVPGHPGQSANSAYVDGHAAGMKAGQFFGMPSADRERLWRAK